MKIEGPPKRSKNLKKFTLILPVEVCDALDAAGKRAGLSRQRTIEAILRQVVTDKNFVLRVK